MKNTNQPTIWFRYVDDTFTLFKKENDALSFLRYLNGRDNIKFTIEFVGFSSQSIHEALVVTAD